VEELSVFGCLLVLIVSSMRVNMVPWVFHPDHKRKSILGLELMACKISFSSDIFDFCLTYFSAYFPIARASFSPQNTVFVFRRLIGLTLDCE
jgi:hypothetical protein